MVEQYCNNQALEHAQIVIMGPLALNINLFLGIIFRSGSMEGLALAYAKFAAKVLEVIFLYLVG